MKDASTEVQIQIENKAQKTTGRKTDSKRERRKERIKEEGWYRSIDTQKKDRENYIKPDNKGMKTRQN
jgi:hypothetical protein